MDRQFQQTSEAQGGVAGSRVDKGIGRYLGPRLPPSMDARLSLLI